MVGSTRECVCVAGGGEGALVGGCCRFAYGQTNSLNCRCLHQHMYKRGMQIDERVKERERERLGETGRETGTHYIGRSDSSLSLLCLFPRLFSGSTRPLLRFVLSVAYALSISVSLTQHTHRHTHTQAHACSQFCKSDWSLALALAAMQQFFHYGFLLAACKN